MSPNIRKQQSRFSIIYADPPWRFSHGQPDRTTGAKGRVLPYPVMRTTNICDLPIQQIAEQDCVLFLWAIYPMLPDALRVIRSWGFTFKTVAFTWVKENPSGNGFHFGMGYWTRSNPEICLLATRGSPKRISKAVPNLIVSKRREHSRKPDEVRNRIVDLCGDLPRIELFARIKSEGWDVWGDEVDSIISLK
ncbi:MAG: MT-A70 family methyltransferase [Chthonomonadales bacterium]